MPKSLIARGVALLSAAVALGLLLAVAVTLWRESDKPAIELTEKGVSGAALVGGPFELTDQHGNRVSDRDFRGRFMLVYFGYSFCPDVCPTDLAAMAAAIDQLGPAGDRVQPIFITIDPGRDTVQRLAEYAPLFHARLLALTGTPDEIARAAEQYRVYYEKAGEGTDYLMNHSGIVYLMDPEGRFLTHFAQGTPPEEMALKIRSQMSESRNQNS
jgi:cytochrome oxidase Cu insertion factor (SCO1/SenC/PrrC family)